MWAFDRIRIGSRHDAAIDVAARGLVSMQASLIPCIVRRRFDLMIPWNWNVARVVTRSVPLAKVPATASSASHCSGVTNAAGNAQAHHVAERLLELLLGALAAHVAIVLHVGAVELNQLLSSSAIAPVTTSAKPSAIVPRN